MDSLSLQKRELKLYYNSLLEKNSVVTGKFFNSKKMKHFSLLFDDWKKSPNKNEFVFNIIFDVIESPVCKICGKKTSLKSFKDGYRQYCSNKCVNVANSQSDNFSKKISESMKRKFNNEYYTEKYKYVKSKDGENFLISGYCHHGEFWINKNRFARILDNDGILCEKCIEQLTDLDKVENIYKNKFSNEKGFKTLYPVEWKLLTENCKETDAAFSEKRYMYNNKIRERPTCPICNTRKLKYIGSFSGYTQTCTYPDCILSSSAPEQEIYKIVSSIFPDAISRYHIDNEEIDIFIPSLKVGIEFNGLYWHSEKFKHYRWHLQKMQKLRNIGIKMYTIWEDDWREKREIILSQLMNCFNKSQKIYGRKTNIIEVDRKISDEFLKKNHLQGTCKSSFRYGLEYNGELVSLMTFGKKRMIFHSKDDSDYELLRFCNKKNISVIGGADKLFKHFINQQLPKKIISYANYDISDGNVYLKLGFKKVDKIYPGYWWCKDGKKFHRSNFMKQKLKISDNDKYKTAPQIIRESGYYRVWNSGNLKFVWTKE